MEFPKVSYSELDYFVANFKELGINLEKDLLDRCLNGFCDGRNWVLNRFNIQEFPHMQISVHPDEERLKTGARLTASVDTGEPVIVIPAYLFKLLEDSDESTIVTKHPRKLDGTELKYTFTLPQLFESWGVEETTHWIALTQKVESLTSISWDTLVTPRTAVEVYMAQPHELEALQTTHEFFLEKYQTSPVQPLVDTMKDYLGSDQL